MAAFSYQLHTPFLLDSPYNLLPIEMPFLKQAGEISNTASSCFPYNYFSCESITEASNTDTRTPDSSSIDTATQVEPKPQPSMEKKRKGGIQPKDPKESKSRKQKKPGGGGKRTEEKKSQDGHEKKETKACEEPPTGYIHVRARRGQATDSHSLAERVRREKISLRMKMLQGLVPGCDKVAGKAFMLDEIINYVQSLQNQVEFLSMKLASVNPILYDFGVDFDDCMNQPEVQKLGSIVQPLPAVHQTNHTLPTVVGEATTSSSSSYQLVNTSAPHHLLIMHGQGPNAFSQDINTYPMQPDDHHQGFFRPVGFNNMCSFQ